MSRTRTLSALPIAAGVGAQRALSGVLALAIIAMSARLFGTAAAGTAGIALSLSAIAVVLADFGTSPLAIRDFSRRTPSLGEVMVLVRTKLVLAGAVSGLIAVGVAFLDPDRVPAIVPALLSVPLVSAVAIITAHFVAAARGSPLSVAAGSGFVLGALWLALLPSSSPPWLAVAAVTAARAAELLVLLGLLLRARLARHATGSYGVRWLLDGWPVAAQAMLAVAYQRSTLLAAAPFVGSVGTGEIAKGLGLYSIAALAPSAFATALLPTMMRTHGESDARRSLRHATALALASVAPFVIVFAVWPMEVLRPLYGSGSDDSVSFVRWCAAALLLGGPNSLIAYVYLSRDRAHLLAKLSVFTTAASIACVVTGAALWSVSGVGWSVAASEVITTAVFVFAGRKALTTGRANRGGR